MFKIYDGSSTAVVAMSGGVDSFVLATQLVDIGGKSNLEAVFFDYGQSNVAHTYTIAYEQINYLKKEFGLKNTKLHTIKGFDWQHLKDMKEGVDEGNVYDSGKSDELNEKIFVSGRNTLIALALMSLADTKGITEAWMAVQLDPPEWERFAKEPNAGTKDIYPQWVDKMNCLGEHAFKNLVRLRTPYLDDRNDKGDIVFFGNKYKLPYDITYSCRYYPPCGECQQCIIRDKFIK